MVVYIAYSILKVEISSSDFSKAAKDRVNDIADILITFSILLMLYGISNSVKKTVETQQNSKILSNKHAASK